ncbi:DExH-box ATP-dependent RNA helicase DExH8 isoform X1 [Lycium ferocissimum]|uniref:DExH-box ATP-dependent RNA helicase DExH8 isoform X1 n=2 Tax=Lycium ferocissimum TaxID=112874 RepID=UPI00281698CF|nr:DExH-box ATP-dependent RNA helicase DExH8 isoform X1 [Lycium ferocissimum]
MASLPSDIPSSSSSSSKLPEFPVLPVTSLKTKIVEKIQENRVTLIVGETGCGKSSQVPQFLLEGNMEPILCTQPRRFAVVAVARMVAKARNCEVGGEVGYHIGHSRVYSERSKIVFKTAGVLLEEMLEKGLNALKYKVIILDEVHERSVESDLVLVCVKQYLLKKSDLRVVLMSATADIQRYREYFRDLGRGERVELLAIPSSGQDTIYQRNVSYVEQVAELLETDSEETALKCCSSPSPQTAAADIEPEMYKVILNLIIYIHKNEVDIEKGILVFLPTYYALEQQWRLLKRFSETFKVHILHSSINTEQALKAMTICMSHRKVILATNIAESSVTIPKVGYVIDSCRSLQVFWDNSRKTDNAELVWVSKSQADQRRGRTGRTCDGHVYRLVKRSFYGQLEDYEPPAILRLSLRQQILLLCCAESKAINDPKVLLRKALDPPYPEVIDDALSLLVDNHALQKAPARGRYEPTFYGRLLASFSLSFDASILIVKFGAIGMLREGIVLGIMMDMQPQPILRPFGQESLFMKYIDDFFSGDSRTTGLSGKKEVICMANSCAFQFWQRSFKDKHRLEHLRQLFKLDSTKDREIVLPKIEEEWCLFHNLLQSALNQVAESYDEVLDSFHRYRPQFLATSGGIPSYYNPNEYLHKCHIDGEQYLDMDHGLLEQGSEIRKCISVPFLGHNESLADKVAQNLASVVKEMRSQSSTDVSGNYDMLVNGNSGFTGEASLCSFFVRGLCNRGPHCSFSHSLQAERPTCKFFFSLQGCRNGDSCFYSHDSVPSAYSGVLPSLCLPETEDANMLSLLRWFPAPHHGSILILDDNDLYFSSHLARHYVPSSIMSTTSLRDESTLDQLPTGVRILWGHSHPYNTIISNTAGSSVPWSEVKCILWFPKFEAEHKEGQKSVMQTFFEYLAIRMLADTLYEAKVIITMNNIRFSYLQMEKLARECCFFLDESFLFDEQNLGELFDEVKARKLMLQSKPVSYVFSLHPPVDVQSGDFARLLNQNVNKAV